MTDTKTSWSRAGEVYAAGLFLVYAVLLFAHRSSPSLTDTANWTYQGVLLREHLMGHPDPLHTLKHYPVPNSTATVGIGLLACVLPWKFAIKAWLLLQLGASFAAMRHLLRTLQAGWVSWVVMPQAVFLNVNFWYGFLNFELGLACVLLVASLLLRRARGDLGGSWAIAALLLFIFFTHMIAFAFCGLLLLLYAAQTKHWRTLWQLAPSAALSVWYLVGRFFYAGNADGQAGMEPSVQNYSAAFWAFKVNSYLKSFGMVNPESVDCYLLGRTAFALLFLLNLALAGLMLFAIVKRAGAAWNREAEQKFLWLAILLLVPLYLLGPGAALGVSDPGARMLQVALALALALAAGYRPRTGKVAAGCALMLTFFGAAMFSAYAFDPHFPAKGPSSLPARLVGFAHVPNDDQDYLYRALEDADYRRKVFPTGLFLNAQREPSEDGSPR